MISVFVLWNSVVGTSAQRRLCLCGWLSASGQRYAAAEVQGAGAGGNILHLRAVSWAVWAPAITAQIHRSVLARWRTAAGRGVTSQASLSALWHQWLQPVGWEVLDHHRALQKGSLCTGSAVITTFLHTTAWVPRFKKKKKKKIIAVGFAPQAQKYFETVISRNNNNKQTTSNNHLARLFGQTKCSRLKKENKSWGR